MFKKLWHWYSHDFGAVKQIVTMFILSAIFVGGQIWYTSKYTPEKEWGIDLLTALGVLCSWIVVLLIGNKDLRRKLGWFESNKNFKAPGE